MRTTLFEENQRQRNGMMLASGAMQFNPDEKYPLALSPISAPSDIIGYVTDIRRAGDVVSGDFHFFMERDLNSFTVSVFANALVTTDNETITSAKLREVTLIPIPDSAKE